MNSDKRYNLVFAHQKALVVDHTYTYFYSGLLFWTKGIRMRYTCVYTFIYPRNMTCNNKGRQGSLFWPCCTRCGPVVTKSSSTCSQGTVTRTSYLAHRCPAHAIHDCLKSVAHISLVIIHSIGLVRCTMVSVSQMAGRSCDVRVAEQSWARGAVSQDTRTGSWDMEKESWRGGAPQGNKRGQGTQLCL